MLILWIMKFPTNFHWLLTDLGQLKYQKVIICYLQYWDFQDLTNNEGNQNKFMSVAWNLNKKLNFHSLGEVFKST